MAQTTETPLMKQYQEMKAKHPDAVLLFRVGDFYETFGEDAITASEILGVTLTRRYNGKDKTIELAGFPHHALDTYLPKLVRAGKRVAICEQLEEPKLKKSTIKEIDVKVNGYDYGKYSVTIDSEKITAYSVNNKQTFTVCSRNDASEVCAYTNNINDVVTRFICRELDGARMLCSNDTDGIAAEKWDLSECFSAKTQKVVEEVTPAKSEELKQEPKQEPKTGKKMNIKEINCTLTTEQLRELGEPIAYFTMTIPKEAKNLGKQVTKDNYRPQLEAICVQPGRGKMIATDTHILTAMDVKCEGMWPKGDNGKPFECFIDPKAISSLAGKEVDVAVWNDNGKYVTACEAAGVLTQHQFTERFPDWERVMIADQGCNIVIAESAIEPLRKFVKANMGKTKAEQKKRFVVFSASKDADDVMIQIVERPEEYSEEYTQIAKEQFDIKSNYPEHDIRMAFQANLFYYSVQDDFDGSMWIRNEYSAVKFNGAMRKSILMPVRLFGEYEAYFK